MSESAILARGVELCSQINSLSILAGFTNSDQSRLVVSFDVYCDLLEYTVYLHRCDTECGSSTIEDFLLSDDLVFEANGHKLDVLIDFFSAENSFHISAD